MLQCSNLECEMHVFEIWTHCFFDLIRINIVTQYISNGSKITRLFFGLMSTIFNAFIVRVHFSQDQSVNLTQKIVDTRRGSNYLANGSNWILWCFWIIFGRQILIILDIVYLMPYFNKLYVFPGNGTFLWNRRILY